MRKEIIIFITLFLFCFVVFSQSDFPDQCIGKWSGKLYIYQYGKIKDSVNVVLTVSKIPDTTGWKWKTEYLSKKFPVVKDYSLYKKSDEENIFHLNEGNGIVLEEMVSDNKMYSVFETNETIFSSTYELRENELIFELFFGKKAKSENQEVIYYHVTQLQKIKFQKIY